MLRHEQQSIRIHLATVMHRSYKGAHRERRPTGTDDSHQGRGRTEFYAMSEGSDVVGGGGGPAAVSSGCVAAGAGSAHREADRRPCASHDVVPQTVEQLVDFLAPLDFRVAEQVIEVPKIVCPPPLLAQSSARRRRLNCWWRCRRSQHMHWQSLPCKRLGRALQWHWRSRSWTNQGKPGGARKMPTSASPPYPR